MKIYLDNCCFNRPYDEQVYETIRLEAEAKLFVQEKIHNGTIGLVWSFMLDFENNANPYDNQKESIAECEIRGHFQHCSAWILPSSIES